MQCISSRAHNRRSVQLTDTFCLKQPCRIRKYLTNRLYRMVQESLTKFNAHLLVRARVPGVKSFLIASKYQPCARCKGGGLRKIVNILKQ